MAERLLIAFLACIFLIGCGGTSAGSDQPVPVNTGTKGTRSDPYALGEEIELSFSSYSKETAALKLLFTEYWDTQKVQKEYQPYNMENKAGVKGVINVLDASTENSIDLNISLTYLNEKLNETPGFFVEAGTGNPNDSLRHIYSGGEYETLVLSNEFKEEPNPRYLTLSYSDGTANQTIWIVLDSAGQTKETSESSGAQNIDKTQTAAKETAVPAEPDSEKGTEMLLEQMKQIASHLSEASSDNEKGSDFLNRIPYENNLGDMGYDSAEAMVYYGLAANHIRDAVNASAGIDELEGFRLEMNKALDLFPEPVEIKDNDTAAQFMTSCKRFLEQYKAGLQEWLNYLQKMAE